MGYKSPNKHVLYLGWLTSNPSALTTYYGGSTGRALSTTEIVSRVYVPYTGRITRVVITGYASGLAGSNEAWEMLLRLNDAADTSLGSVSLNTASRYWSAVVNIPIVLNDFICIKMVTPNWVQAPTTFSGHVFVLVEGD